jgi:4'-phosphopantetheinyl transferase
MMPVWHTTAWSSLYESRPFLANSLSDGGFDLWLAWVDDIKEAEIHDLHHTLSPDEHHSAGRMRRPRDRLGYVIARGMVRKILSRYQAIDPRDWRFSRDANGRPRISGTEIPSSLHFSLSHTDGLIACLVSTFEQAAVDVERIHFASDLRAIGEHVLHPAEIAALDRLPREMWTSRFFDLWTLKEAYSKARGLGLALSFRDMAFEFSGAGIPHVRFSNEIQDDPASWWFWRDRLPSGHVIAIAAKWDPAAWRRSKANPVRIFELASEPRTAQDQPAIDLVQQSSSR